MIAQQGCERGLSRAALAGQNQRPPITLDAGGMKQQKAALTQRELQVHAHLGR
jgi:hypothetical protein